MFVRPVPSTAYRVFHHDLLMTEFHHIDYKNYTDGIRDSKLHFMASRKSNYLNERSCHKVPSLSPPCRTKSNTCDGRILWSDVGMWFWQAEVRLRKNICWSSLTKIAHLSAFKFCWWNMSRWARKPQTALSLWCDYSQSMGNRYHCFEKKNGKLLISQCQKYVIHPS